MIKKTWKEGRMSGSRTKSGSTILHTTPPHPDYAGGPTRTDDMGKNRERERLGRGLSRKRARGERSSPKILIR